MLGSHSICVFLIVFINVLILKTIIGKIEKYSLGKEYDWAQKYDYKKEDHEIGIGGQRYKRLLEISSSDIFNLVKISPKSRSSNNGQSRLVSIVRNQPLPRQADIGTGTGLDPNDCTDPDQKGGAAATTDVSKPCNYTLWKEYRQEFLDKIENAEFDIGKLQSSGNNVNVDFTPYIQKLLDYYYDVLEKHKNSNTTSSATREAVYHFFEHLCISCTGEPLLQCNSTGQCECWKYYIGITTNGTTDCFIPVGKRCHHILGAKCEKNSFCDQEYKCRCLIGKQCSDTNNLKVGNYYYIILLLLLIFGHVLYNFYYT